MPSTSHRSKRPYQPSITAFFARPDQSDSSIPHITTTPAPALPSSVQASLLNVGMRVRKSVPEGYKNKQRELDNGDAYSVKPVQQLPTETYSHPRELLPFCGLHKIGGFAEQPVHTPSSNDWGWPTQPVNSQPHLHLFTTPFSSQGSTNSNISTDSAPARQLNANSHKRSFDDAANDVFPLSNTNSLFAPLDDEEPVSPMSSTPPPNAYPISHTAMPQLSPQPLRPFAQPRTRGMQRLKSGNTQQLQLQELGFKSMALPTTMDAENADMGDAETDAGRNSSDFEEADFLRPVWERGEVEMGGV
ncbi:uncharacterized protein BDZ99DRAFT_127616 [Mytilinidion resinicola]|uniref:Uncharacterized protein n=1 Tax=Mytilinidion resinicola TaxID=574789 RepID=A0A6A6Z5P8_9PEZI|nr:uncharacterized protein BDZ99DRAFT_127616 [Mytilinidion resinicola]KAF2816049.1 hypothetical protein BDZ99DRAFT_127616 [Mytilinidion resinicola]